jgi:ribosomal protein S18 acetylase RimI-like enzyme
MQEQAMEPLDQEMTVDARPSGVDIRFLDDQINAFNVARTGYEISDDVLLASFVRDADGAIRAGIYGWTWGGCCEISSLWVHEAWRGRGIGGRLLALAESEALRRGCRQLVLDTHSFQAPLFYQRLGYEVVGIVDDYPLGHQKYYLRKRLAAA